MRRAGAFRAGFREERRLEIHLEVKHWGRGENRQRTGVAVKKWRRGRRVNHERKCHSFKAYISELCEVVNINIYM